MAANAFEKYQSLFDNLVSGCGIYRVINEGKYGKDYIIEAFNKKSLELENKTAEEVIGKSLFDLRPNIDEYGLIDVFRQVWLTGEAIYYPSKIYIDDTYNNYYDNRVFKLDDDLIVALYNDVTDYVQTQLDLKNSQQKLEKYFNEAPYGIFITDDKGNYLEVNNEASRMTGYSQDELTNMNIFDLNTVEDREQALIRFKALDHLASHKVESRYMTKKGEKRLWTINATKLDANNYIGFTEDITERKHLENQIAYEQNRARKYFEVAGVMFVVLDQTGCIIDINKKGCAILGYAEEEILGKNWFDCFLPKSQVAEVQNVFEKVISGEWNNVEFYENQIVNAEGEERTISWHNSTILDETGKIINILSAGTDITGQKRVEKALIESEEKFKYIFENSILGKSLTLLSGEIIVNNSFSKMLGYTKEELMGETWHKISHPDDLEISQQAVDKLTSGELQSINFQKRYIKKDGGILWADIHTSLRCDAEGNPMYFITSVLDITEKRRVEAQLRESEERYRIVVNNTYDWEMWVSTANKVEYISPSCKRIVGFSEESFYQDPDLMFKVIIPEDQIRFKRHWDQVHGHQVVGEIEYRIKTKDGSILWLEQRSQPVYTKDGQFSGTRLSNRDITGRKTAEEALRESERSKAMLLSNMPGMAYRCENDAQWTMRFLSKGCYELTGYEPESLIDNKVLPYSDLIEVSSRGLVRFKIEEALASRETFHLEYEIVTADGKHKWVYEVGQGVFDSFGNIEALEGIVIDITDRKLAVETLRRQEEEQRLLLEHLQVGIIVHNADSAILYSNYLAESILGVSKDQIFQKLVSDPSWHFTNQSGEPLSEDQYPFSLVNKSRRALSNYEIGVVCCDSVPIKWLMVNGFPILNHQGDIEKVLISFIDITEKKRIEENYRMIIQTAMDGFWLVDQKGNILEANEAYCQLTGYSRKEILNMNIVDLDCDQDQQAVLTQIAIVVDKGGQRFETKHKHKDGRILDVEVSAGHLEGSDNIFVFIHDLTYRKEMEKKRLLLELQLRNQQKLESIGTLASGVAHEINNPINGILNYGQIILDAESNDQDIKDYAREIISETNRVSRIVRNLLEFSRQSEQEYSFANIEEIISKTLSLIRTVIRHDQTELNINVAEDLPQIYCNSQQIQQVLMNLITNAKDALDEKYPGYHENKRINIWSKLTHSNGQKGLMLVVEDFGIGISKNIIDKIFDPFFTTKGKTKGTGLGLSISYGIIQDHGGEMRVESQEGQFTRFTILLPIDHSHRNL